MQKSFTVYDSKSELYSLPKYAPTTMAMLRQFAEVAKDPETEIGRYPADFTLFETGTFDEYTGHATELEAKVNLGLALDHISSPFTAPMPSISLADAAEQTIAMLKEKNQS